MLLLLLLLQAAAAAALPAAAGYRDLVPRPRHAELLGGFVRPASAFEVSVTVDGRGADPSDPVGALANWFRAELAELLVHQTSWNAAGSKARLGRPMAVVLAVGNMAGSPAAAVADPHGLILGSGEASPEASELVLRPGTLKIAAPAIAGLRHGMRTALKLLRGNGEAAAGGQPAIRIVDGPVSAYRGVMIDNVRQPHGFEFHMAMLDHLANAKLNVYQLHASDDQGYSMPSVAFPNLPTGAALTAGEARQLATKAAALGIEVVAEIDLPGHSATLLAKLPQLAARSNKTGATCDQINITSPTAIGILQTLLSEVMELFPGRFHHLGADEVRWDPDCGMTKRSYHDFINTMNAFVRAKNRSMIVWEGFDPAPGETAATIDTNVVVAPFDSIHLTPWPHRPHHYYDSGYRIINTDWNPLYLVKAAAAGFAAGPEVLADWNPTKYGNYPYMGAASANWQSLPSDNWNSPSYHSQFTAENASCWPDASKHPGDYIPSPYPGDRLLGGALCSWGNPELAEMLMFFGNCSGVGSRMPATLAPGTAGAGFYPRPGPRGKIVAERLWAGAVAPTHDVLQRVDCAWWDLPPPPPPSPPPIPGGTFAAQPGACRDPTGETYSNRLDHEGNISFSECRGQCLKLGIRCDAYDIEGKPPAAGADETVSWCGVWGFNITASDAGPNFQFIASTGGRVCHGDTKAGPFNTCFHRPPNC